MFYKVYKSIKTELNSLTFIKNISWYNNQFEQGFAIDTTVYIEFSDEITKQLFSKTINLFDLPVRLFFGKKLLPDNAGTILDSDLELFSSQLGQIVNLVDNFMPNYNTANLTTRPLQLMKISSLQNISGWQIWICDFTTKVDKQTLKTT